MKRHIKRLLDRAVIILIAGLVMFATGLLFYFLALTIGDIAKQNQTYDQYQACVLSVPAADRDQARIERCWKEVQEDTGIEVKRYDK